MKRTLRILPLLALILGLCGPSLAGNDGTAVGSPTYTAATGFGQALTLSGAGQSVALPAKAFDFLPTDNWTWETRIKLPTVSSEQVLLSVDLSSTQFTYFAINPSGRFIFNLGNSGRGSGDDMGDGFSRLDNGAQHTLAVVVSGAGTVATCYIDGVQGNSFTAPSGQTFKPGLGAAPYVGQRGPFSGNDRFYAGQIDEMAFFDVARYSATYTPSAAPYAGTETGLRALYHFDGGLTDSDATNGNQYAGGNYPGSPNGAAVSYAASAAGFGQAFDATGGTVVFPTQQFNFGGTAAWAIECRVKTTSANTELFYDVVNNYGNQAELWLGTLGGKFSFSISGESPANVTASTAINDGAWHTVAVSVGAGGSPARAYIDGVAAQVTSSGSGNTGFLSNSLVTLGSQAGSNPYSGQIDEFAIFAANEFPAAYTPRTSPYTGSEAGLKALYHFDGNLNDGAGSAPAVATAYTSGLSTSSGVNGAPVTITFTPNGTSAATVTPSVSGVPGTFSPASVTFDGTSAAKSVTFTPTAAGTAALSSANGGGLTDPGALTYGVTASAATTYASSLSATSGPAGTAVTVTYTPNGTSTATVTPSASGVAGAFSPATVTFTGASPKTVTFTASAVGTATLSSTSSGSLTNPPNLTYTATAPAATAFTSALSAASGAVGSPVTVTFTPNGPSSATVTPAASGVSGAFSPAAVTFDGSASAKTLTFTPSASGTATLSATNGGSLSNPAALTYTVNATVTIPAAPTGLTLTSLAQVMLSWTASAGASTYSTYRDGALLHANLTGTTDTDTVALGSSHSYAVLAANGAGGSAQTASVAASTGASGGTTTALIPTITKPNGVPVLTWPPDPGAVTYRVLRRVAGGDYVTIATVTPPATTYTDGAEPVGQGTVYYTVVGTR